MRDLCAPIGPSIATLARGRGPDYARAAVGRVPQVRVQSLHYYLNAVSGPSGRASALPLHNPNLHTVMSLCAGLSVCFSDRATRIFSGSRMSPRGLKTAKIKGLGALGVLKLFSAHPHRACCCSFDRKASVRALSQGARGSAAFAIASSSVDSSSSCSSRGSPPFEHMDRPRTPPAIPGKETQESR